MSVYKHPLYYEIAFGFVDAVKQVDLFEIFIKKYSGIKVKRYLDLGCGSSFQLREIARRGNEAVGLDCSAPMLTFLKERAQEVGAKIETIKADMNNFKLGKKADFAFILMGTISYIKSNQQFLAHLDSVAESLNSGGLYFIENFALDWAKKDFFGSHSWIMERDGIKVKTTWRIDLQDTLSQTIRETIKMEVNDRGKELIFEESSDTKLIFPQEFLTLIELNNKFEFVGWFEHNSIKKLMKAHLDNIIILRRK